MRVDPNEQYNKVRCVTCGRPWDGSHDPATGKGDGPHPTDAICNRYRPAAAPAWVAEALARHERAREAARAAAANLPASVDDAEEARREVAGRVPTRERAEDGGRVERSGYIRVLGGEDARNGTPNGEVRSDG